MEKERKSRKRKLNATPGNTPAAINADTPPATETPPASQPSPAVVENSGGHRAGFDAFMTGFTFVSYLVHQTAIPLQPADFLPATLRTDAIVNRIYLMCKDFPMLMQKSAFSRCSAEHEKKMRKLRLVE